MLENDAQGAPKEATIGKAKKGRVYFRQKVHHIGKHAPLTFVATSRAATNTNRNLLGATLHTTAAKALSKCLGEHLFVNIHQFFHLGGPAPSDYPPVYIKTPDQSPHGGRFVQIAANSSKEGKQPTWSWESWAQLSICDERGQKKSPAWGWNDT